MRLKPLACASDPDLVEAEAGWDSLLDPVLGVGSGDSI